MNLRFPGQYADKESNLFYNGARYYDPSTGRYPSADPQGLNWHFNPYSYAHFNPLSYYDPTGEAATLAWCFGGPVGCAIGATAAVGSLIWAQSQMSRPKASSGAKSKSKSTCDDDDNDDCKQVASDWELEQADIDAHEAKKGLGSVRLFEICKCKSGGFAVKRKGCQGPIIYRL